MPEPTFTAGRTVISIGNLMYAVGAFLADFNETHVYNPRWPPHARFHNGQTMTLGVLLSGMSLWLAYRPALDSSMSPKAAKDSLFCAAAVGSFYCAAGLSAILYPGTDWQDPGSSFGGQQKYLFSGIVAAMWVGYALEVSRMGKAKAG